MKKIWIVLIFCFLIRLIGLNQSMWLDEAISANVAKWPINEIVNNFSINDFHPPVHYWFLNMWVKIFGDEVIMMRLSSVLFSLITILLVFKIGKEIKDEKVGLWAALILGINPLFIYFSQELRMYMMAVMWLTASFYFLIKIKKKADWKNILSFNIFTFLSFVTFYGSAFFIAAELTYLLVNRKIKLTFLNSIGITIAILAVSPLLFGQLKNSGEMLNQITNWSLLLGEVNLKNLLLIPLKFSVGRIKWYPKMAYYLITGGASLVVWGLAIKGFLKNKMLAFLLVTPIIFGIIFSFKSPLLQYFRFLYLIPALSLLLAIGWKSIKVKMLLFLGFLIFSGMYLLNQNFWREDWKGLVGSLSNGERVYMVDSFADPVKYYNPEIQVSDIRSQISEQEIAVIPYGEDIHGIDHVRLLGELGYKRILEKSFREIVLEKWKK